MAKETKYTAIGRRKRSVAKVTIKPGKGNITVNGKDVKDYMPYETLVMDLVQPLELTNGKDKYDVNVSVVGGGFSGQTGAIRLGLARALMLANQENRPTLKANGMYILTGSQKFHLMRNVSESLAVNSNLAVTNGSYSCFLGKVYSVDSPNDLKFSGTGDLYFNKSVLNMA